MICPIKKSVESLSYFMQTNNPFLALERDCIYLNQQDINSIFHSFGSE